MWFHHAASEDSTGTGMLQDPNLIPHISSKPGRLALTVGPNDVYQNFVDVTTGRARGGQWDV